MGWWRTRTGCVLGDAAADYVEGFSRMGSVWIEPSDIPGEVRERLDALYVEGIGRVPSDDELGELLAFSG